MTDETVLESTNRLGVVHSLKARGFTVFEDETFKFSPGMNVIVGESGAGKTHLLKLAYAATKVLYPEKAGRLLNEEKTQVTLSDKLEGVFLPDKLEHLCRWQNGSRSDAEVSISFFRPGKGRNRNSVFSFFLSQDGEGLDIGPLPRSLPKGPEGGPIFLPPREVLSLVPEFVEDYRKLSVRFEETYYDLALTLLASPLRQSRNPELEKLFDCFDRAVDGRLTARRGGGGRLYLKRDDGLRLETTLMAEGHRKLATLARLARVGALVKHGTIFWDEPEANLNPGLMGILADAIVWLTQNGCQFLIATHSLFFLREIAIRVDRGKAQGTPVPARYFSLSRSDRGLSVERADDVDGLGVIASLDAALKQDDAMERLYWDSLA